MTSIPTVVSVKTIDRFLSHISTAGVPGKVDMKYLKTVGFRSSNDGALITTFKILGFVDNAGIPTNLWREYKDKSKQRKVLGKAIKEGYPELFELYPDANRKDDEAVRNWMRTTTGASEVTVTRGLSTFKKLVSHADFDGIDESPTEPVKAQETNADKVPIVTALGPQFTRGAPAININIELQIPATNDPKIYENFFEAMKKNLFDDEAKS